MGDAAAVIMALVRRPEMILPVLQAYANVGFGLLVWYLDMLAAFLVTFALAYGSLSLAECLCPRPPGARPRVWRVPALFAVVAAAFFCGLDGVVSDVLRNGMDALSLLPGRFVLRLAGCVWLGGAAVSLWRVGRGVLRLSRAAGRLPLCLDAAATDVLRRALADAGVRRGVSLRTGAAGTAIFSCGFRRACVVVPEDFGSRYRPDGQYAILLHECLHIRRFDAILLPCLAVVGAVLWFDPIVRRALRRMRGDMELLCDWTVLRRHGVPPGLYAGLIVGAAANQTGAKEFASGFSEEYRVIARRLGHILGDGTFLAASGLSRRRAGLFLAVLGAGLIAGAVYYTGLEPAMTPPQSIRGANGETVRYEERHGVFGVYGFGTTSRATEGGTPPAS